MPTPPTTTGLLMDLATDHVRHLDQLRRAGALDATAYRTLDGEARRMARLACRCDAQRRASLGWLNSGRIPRDVAATLLETSEDHEPD